LLLADVLLKFKFIRTFFKQKEQYPQENTDYIMGAFITFGILFWVFDSLLGFMVFYDDISFLDLLALNIPSHQIWARAFVIIACLIGGLTTIRMFYRQQESDKALQESEDDFKKFLEYSPVAIAILDKNENIEYTNRKYAETIGYTDKINLSDWSILAYPDKDNRKWVIEKWNADVEKALREGKEIEPSEHNVTCKDGKVRVMEISWTFVTDKTIAIFTDITERKRAEEALAEREEKFRLIAENSIDCVWTLNTRLKFTYLSPSVEGIMGFKPEQWVGTTLSSHFKKKEFLKVGILAAKTFKNYKTFTYVIFETKMLNNKNEEVDLEISSKVLLNSQGKLLGLQGVTRDIAERKQAEKELAKYHDHLEELVRKRTEELDNRVSEVEQLNIEMVNLMNDLRISNEKLKGTTNQLGNANKELEAFAYSVSHDLRAPLRNIDGFSQILLEDYSGILDKQGRHYLQRVRAGTQNMGQLIDDILSLSRSGRHHMNKKTINMESIVKEVCKSLENELKDRKVDFIIHECPTALADSHLVKIVFTNLLSNALKFTGIRKNAKIETGSMTEDGHTVFFIKDNGTGFDMNYADKLFIAFQRLHRAEEYEGTGIGLAIVQRIIHRHGGRIWAESELNVGTTFYFTFSV